MKAFHVAATAACLAWSAAPLLAEDEQRSGAAITEEIIVTATYRETNLMDTAQSVNAVTDDLVQAISAQSMEDIFTLVPGLAMSGDLEGNNRYSIRGLTSQTGGTGYFLVGAAVGVYLDGTPVTAALGPDNQVSGNLFDIERVEVLKGPQGTLFGEGSQGGTIRYLYKQPDPTRFDAAVNASYSNMEESDDTSHRLDAMVNVPFGDGWAVRLVGWNSERAGFVDNVDPYEEDYNDGETTGGRAVVRYEGERFALTASLYNNDQGTTGGSATVAPYDARSFRVPGFYPESSDQIDIYSFIVEVDFAWANFQSLTSFTDRQISSISEFALETRDVLDFYYGGAAEAGDHPNCAIQGLCLIRYPGQFNLGLPTVVPDGRNLVGMDGFIDSYSERWVQEFRFVSPGDRRLRWTAGAFWKDSEDHSQSQQQAIYFPGRFGATLAECRVTTVVRPDCFGPLMDSLLMVPANTHTDFLEEYAVFGEVTYDLTPTLEGTVGVRVSSLEQFFDYSQTGTDDTPVSPKVNLSWRPRNELLVYFNYATGFRPGNVNSHMQFNVDQYDLLQIPQRLAAGQDATDLYEVRDLSIARLFFDGDEVASYEVGLKTTLFDGRVQLMTAAYYLDWEDMILVENDPVIGATNPLSVYNTNSGGAEISGFELELSAFLTDRLSIRFAGDLNDTKVKEGPLFASSAAELTSSKDNELVQAPGHSASLAVDYAIPIMRDWTLTLHADHAWVDGHFADAGNTRPVPKWRKANASATARSGDGKWRLALFGTNLANDEIIRSRQGSATYFWHPPRQIGIEVGYSMR